jgi:CheY-like chemotaxis protein
MDIRETLREVLQAEGYSVETACNGREALDVLSNQHRPCVIFLDLMMPVMSGPELLEVLQHDGEAKTIPVVIVSAYCDYIESANGVAEVIPKPMRLSQVLRSAHRFCD